MLKSFSIALSDNSRKHTRDSRVIFSTFSIGLNFYEPKHEPSSSLKLINFFSLGIGDGHDVNFAIRRPRRIID